MRTGSVSCAIAVICITLLSTVLTPSRAMAQQIVKWTDEQGQVHFSDHAPPGKAATNVTVQKAPRGVAADAPAATGNSYARKPGSGSGPAQTAPSEESQRTAAAREQERKLEDLRRATAAAKQQADKETVARCKAAREIYCNEGADAIRKREQVIAEIQYAEALNHRDDLARRGIYTPAPPAPPNP